MDNELTIGQSYSVDYLLNYLSQNERKNIYLASANQINLLNMSRSINFVINDIQLTYLHHFEAGIYPIPNLVTTIYIISPE